MPGICGYETASSACGPCRLARIKPARRKRGLPPRQPSREAETAMTISPRQLLFDMFEAAVGAALPEKCLPPHLPPRPPGRVIVVGAGEAGGAMAHAVEDHW